MLEQITITGYLEPISGGPDIPSLCVNPDLTYSCGNLAHTRYSRVGEVIHLIPADDHAKCVSVVSSVGSFKHIKNGLINTFS